MIDQAALTAILQRLINPLPILNRLHVRAAGRDTANGSRCSALHAHMQRVDHDPVAIAWVRDDEYDLEAIAIRERLTDTMEGPEVAALVHAVFVRMFDGSPVPAADDAMWRAIAAEIVEATNDAGH